MSAQISRKLVSIVASSAVVAALLGAVSSVHAAPGLPEPGSECSAGDHWNELPITRTKNGWRAAEKQTRTSDLLVCIPDSWVPHEHFEQDTDVKPARVQEPTGLGTWTTVPYPAVDKVVPYRQARRLNTDVKDCLVDRVALDRSRGVNASNLPWDLSDQTNWPQGLGDWSRTEANRVPTTGTIKGLIIGLIPKGTPADRRTLLRWRPADVDASQYLQDYFYAQSYGQLNVEIATPMLRLEFDPGDVDPLSYTANPAAMQEILESAGDAIDLEGLDFLITRTLYTGSARAGAVFTFDRDLAASEQGDQGSASPSSNGLRNYIVMPYQASQRPTQGRFTLVHELGHLMGLPDLYAEPGINAMSSRFSGNIMTMHGNAPAGFTGYERYLMGWLPELQVRCILPKEMRESPPEVRSVPRFTTYESVNLLPIDDLSATSGGTRLLLIRTTRDQVIAVESRRNMHSTGGLVKEGLLTYSINGSSASARCSYIDPSTGERGPSTVECDSAANIDSAGPPPLELLRDKVCFGRNCWDRDRSLQNIEMPPYETQEFIRALNDRAVLGASENRLHYLLDPSGPHERIPLMRDSRINPVEVPSLVIENQGTGSSGVDRAETQIQWCYSYQDRRLGDGSTPNGNGYLQPTTTAGSGHFYCLGDQAAGLW